MTTKMAEFRSFASLESELWGIFPFRRKRSSADLFPAAHNFIAKSGLFHSIAGYGTGMVIIFLITVFFRAVIQVNATTAGFTFLLAILSASALWGLGVSAMMSVAATLALDYFFLPPVGSLDIDDPQDWVALFSFLITAVLGSTLSARAQSRAVEADFRRQELQRLYVLSQRLLSEAGLMSLSRAIPQHILELFGANGVAIFLSGAQETYRAGIEQLDLEDGRLRLAAEGEEVQADGQSNIWFASLKLGPNVIGSVGVSGPPISQGTMGALGCLIAAAFERAGAIERVTKMEAARESEQFRSMMLDAITHDFRTPLTGIKTSVTALLTDLEFTKEQENDLLAIIDEECERIDQLIDKASQMAQFQSGEVKLHPRSHPIGDLISRALAECKGISLVRPIQCHTKLEDSHVLADLAWASSALVQLIVNAHLYSSPGKPISIFSEESDGSALIHVSDHGPGIEKTETARIFEKYYRCNKQGIRAHGTGMGLPIAKAIIEAQGGTIEVVSQCGYGSVFTVSLPLDRRFARNARV